MEQWPYLVLTCLRSELAATEDWTSGLLLPETLAGEFRGFRVEPDGERVRLVLTFAVRTARDRILSALQDRSRSSISLGKPPPSLRCAESGAEPDRDWVGEVEATVKAVPLGRRYAALPGRAAPHAARQSIRIPRGRAFGTGEHPSTRLAAALVEEEVEPGSSLLDLGAGTGLLAAVARLQGARPVVAVDHDSLACRAARTTAELNHLSDFLVVCGTAAALRPGPRYQAVAANLEEDALLELLPALSRVVAPGGSLILSGLLREQVGIVVERGRRWGFLEKGRRAEGEWSAVLLSPRPGLRPRSLVPEGAVRHGMVRLPRQEAHHLLRVRRTRAEEAVEVLDGRGRTWSGVLHRQGSLVDRLQEEPSATEPPLEVSLLQAVPHQAGRMEGIVRQATELGVSRILPFHSARCQGSGRAGGARLQRWRRVAAEATKQCGRTVVPQILAPCGLEEVVDRADLGQGILMDPSGRSLETALAAPIPSAVRLLIGPEGGWTPAERGLAEERGFMVCRLGPRILRTETAAIAALSMVLGTWGDLTGRRRFP
ncbi:MAG: RsmE family RNA methyltransferase [Acidobacteriota bacterium]